MWLLLVAAGSGYLARCWHKTLKPKPSDQALLSSGEESHTESSSGSLKLVNDVSPAVSRLTSDASTADGSSGKAPRRTFSPRALGKKLFFDGSPTVKNSKNEYAADEKKRLIEPDVGVATGGRSESRRNSWSGFKGKKKQAAEEKNSKDSPGWLDKLRWSSEKRKSRSASSSSRNLSSFLAETDILPNSFSFTRGSSVEGSGHIERSNSSIDSCTFLANADAESPDLIRHVLVKDRFEGSDRIAWETEAGISSIRPVEDLTKKSSQISGVLANCKPPVVIDPLQTPAEMSGTGKEAKGIDPGVAHTQLGMKPSSAEINRGRSIRVNKIREALESKREDSLGFGNGKRRADACRIGVEAEGQSLSNIISGKRTKDSNKIVVRDGNGEITLASITGKRMKDLGIRQEVDGQPRDVNFEPPDSSKLMLEFDGSGLFSQPDVDERLFVKTPKKSKYTGRLGSSKGYLRKMRESPKPISALESCLRAQLPFREEGSQVSRALDFSSFGGKGNDQDGIFFRQCDASNSQKSAAYTSNQATKLDEPGRMDGELLEQEDRITSQQEGVVGLPVLRTIPKNGHTVFENKDPCYCRRQVKSVEGRYPRKVVVEDGEGRVLATHSNIYDIWFRDSVLPVDLKKRKISQACHISSSHKLKGFELEALVIPPMEGLLFSFGVGIGVMSTMKPTDDKGEKLDIMSQQSDEKERESLHSSVVQAKDTSSDVTGHEKILKSSEFLCTTAQSTASRDLEQMAELEAQLEAELEHLTGKISAQPESSTADFEELDPEGIAGIANGDLSVDGLPASIDWDDDNDDFLPTEEKLRSGGVAPRDLARVLRKLQSSWHESRLSELELELEEAENKLVNLKKELQMLKNDQMTPASNAGGNPMVFRSGHEEIVKDISPINGSSAENSQVEKIAIGTAHDQPQEEKCNVLDAVSDFSDNNQKDDQSLREVLQNTSLLYPVGSVANLLSSEALSSEAQANDQVCDEFLKSVFDSGQQEELQSQSSQLFANIITNSSDDSTYPYMGTSSAIPNHTCVDIFSYQSCSSSSEFTDAPHTPVDIDRVVGKLRRGDSQGVKNALNALLSWDAASDDSNSSEDELRREEAPPLYSRRPRGQTATPYKSTGGSQMRLETFDRSVVDDRGNTIDRNTAISHSIDYYIDEARNRPTLDEVESKMEERQKRINDLILEEERVARKKEVPRLDKFGGSRRVSDDGPRKGLNFEVDGRRQEPHVDLNFSSTHVDRDLSSFFLHREEISRAGTSSPVRNDNLLSNKLSSSPKARKC